MLMDYEKDMMMIGRPLSVYPDKPTSSCMVDFVVGLFNGKKNVKDKLELTGTCWLEDIGWGDINLCYTEHATDYWCSDTETTVDLDKETAEKIIGWLQDKFHLKPNSVLDRNDPPSTGGEPEYAPGNCSMILKWNECPKCGSENFAVGTTKTFCCQCDWETTEYPYATPE